MWYYLLRIFRFDENLSMKVIFTCRLASPSSGLLFGHSRRIPPMRSAGQMRPRSVKSAGPRIGGKVWRFCPPTSSHLPHPSQSQRVSKQTTTSKSPIWSKSHESLMVGSDTSGDISRTMRTATIFLENEESSSRYRGCSWERQYRLE